MQTMRMEDPGKCGDLCLPFGQSRTHYGDVQIVNFGGGCLDQTAFKVC
jgi:hypothetical protein